MQKYNDAAGEVSYPLHVDVSDVSNSTRFGMCMASEELAVSAMSRRQGVWLPRYT